jgi:hypothetical protein
MRPYTIRSQKQRSLGQTVSSVPLPPSQAAALAPSTPGIASTQPLATQSAMAPMNAPASSSPSNIPLSIPMMPSEAGFQLLAGAGAVLLIAPKAGRLIGIGALGLYLYHLYQLYQSQGAQAVAQAASSAYQQNAALAQGLESQGQALLAQASGGISPTPLISSTSVGLSPAAPPPVSNVVPATQGAVVVSLAPPSPTSLTPVGP